MHGEITGIMKNQIYWIMLDTQDRSDASGNHSTLYTSTASK
jgi:hypothetical protein